MNINENIKNRKKNWEKVNNINTLGLSYIVQNVFIMSKSISDHFSTILAYLGPKSPPLVLHN